MTDEAGIGDELKALRAELAAQGDAHPETTEDRLRRLENAIAAVQDTRLMEERVLARLSGRLPPDAPPPGVLLDGPPPANDYDPAAHPNLPALPPAALLGTAPPAASGLLRELRLMVGMFFDYRFTVSRAARFVPILALAGMVLSFLFLSSNNFPWNWLWAVPDKTVDIVLALVTYKVLSRETARYRKEVSYLPPYRR
jgi:hypothetical protein